MSYKATKLLTVGLMAIACVMSILKVGTGREAEKHMAAVMISFKVSIGQTIRFLHRTNAHLETLLSHFT